MAEEKLDSQLRREQIAEAALGIVASEGLRRLSVAGVARRVGLVPSGIYRHFKSKEAMLQAVLDLLAKRLEANVQAACEESPDALGRLKGVYLRHVRFIREGRAIPRLIFSDDVHSGHPERRRRVLRILEGYLGQIARLVRQGQEEGQIRAGLNPQTVALAFVGMIVPAAIYWHLTEGGFDVTQHAARAWQLFLTAVAAEKPDSCSAQCER